MTWEPKDNLSEDLVRDFEEAYWTAVKNGDSEFVDAALQYGGATAANVADADRRTALHFAAALNQADLIEKFVAAGALTVLRAAPLIVTAACAMHPAAEARYCAHRGRSAK